MLYFWLIVVVSLTVIEASTINLVTIWFIASGLITMVVSLFTESILIQATVFVVVGVILLLTTKKYLIGFLNVKKQNTNADRVVGMSGEVTQDITKIKSGEVYVDGKKWTAVSEKEIKIGSVVKITNIEGVKLRVEEEK